MRILSLLCLFVSGFTFSQESKDLLKLLNGEYLELPGSKTYSKKIPENADVHVGYDPVENTYYCSKDTTGVVLGEEFIRFRDSLHLESGELFKLVKKDWVTVANYDEFLEYVIDSISREKILRGAYDGYSELPEEDAVLLLDYEDEYYDPADIEIKEFDNSDPQKNREIFNWNYSFNWEKKFDYNKYVGSIVPMYLRTYERIGKEWELDTRKLIYTLTTGGRFDPYHKINAYPDESVWSADSKYPFDMNYYMSNNWMYYAGPNPIQGLNGNQIQAYLHFVQKSIQKTVDDKKLPYNIVVTLPDQDELNKVDTCNECSDYYFILGDLDLTDQWKITNADYRRFQDWVKDSIIREKLFFANEDIMSSDVRSDQVKGRDVYFDEVNFDWREFDPSDAVELRKQFYFNYKYDYLKKIGEEKLSLLLSKMFDGDIVKDGKINLSAFDPKKCFYKYQWKDYKSMSRKPKAEEKLVDGQTYYSLEDNNPRVRNLSLGYGIRRWVDLSEFNIIENINVTPGIQCEMCNQLCIEKHGELQEDQLEASCGKCKALESQKGTNLDFVNNPDGLAQGLTYQQALAFYHWSYVKGMRQEKKWNTELEYFPSEEEFKQIQSGKPIVKKNVQVKFPSPFFRYVIHVYKKPEVKEVTFCDCFKNYYQPGCKDLINPKVSNDMIYQKYDECIKKKK